MRKRVRLRQRGRVPVIEIVGGIRGRDTAAVTELFEGVKDLGTPVVAVDLSETTFLDSHGLGAFVYYRKMLGARGTEIVLVRPQEFMRGMLETTNLDQVFKVVDSLEEL